jgi:hypothetical protein
MIAGPGTRGTRLLLAHCASFDPAAPTARERLEDALGAELARKLVLALCAGAPVRGEDAAAALGARAVFAA